MGEPGQPGPAFDAVAAGAGVAGGMPPAIRLQVELVVIGSDGTITLHLTDGVTVTYGGPDEFEAKAEAIAAILAYADDQGSALVSIDVTAPAAPTARFGVDRGGDAFGGDTCGEPYAYAVGERGPGRDARRP